jgi:hypothetical protein
MAIQTAALRLSLATAYGTACPYGAVYTTAPGGSAGTEPSGGSPAYARKPLTWSGANPNVASGTFDIPASTTIVGAGLHSALTAGVYEDGVAVTSQAFASQGTYAVTFTTTVS